MATPTARTGDSRPIRNPAKKVKRGEIWTVAGGSYYSGKPRPALILQSDFFSDIDSLTICPITSFDTRTPRIRVPLFPDESNGLESPSWLAADKIVSLPKSKFGQRIGHVDAETLAELNRAIIVFLHLDGAHPTRAPRRR